MKIEGLPEGVELVRVGIPRADEFELYGTSISKGPRGDSVSQLVVRPAQGWEFKYDIRAYGYVPTLMLTKPLVMTATVTFRVNNRSDWNEVNDGLNALAKLPGYVDGTVKTDEETESVGSPAA